MPFAVHTEGKPTYIKISSLPLERQPYVAFSTAELAHRFCVLWSVHTYEVLPFDASYAYDHNRELVLFETRVQLEEYAAAPAKYALEKLLVPFSAA